LHFCFSSTISNINSENKTYINSCTFSKRQTTSTKPTLASTQVTSSSSSTTRETSVRTHQTAVRTIYTSGRSTFVSRIHLSTITSSDDLTTVGSTTKPTKVTLFNAVSTATLEKASTIPTQGLFCGIYIKRVTFHQVYIALC